MARLPRHEISRFLDTVFQVRCWCWAYQAPVLPLHLLEREALRMDTERRPCILCLEDDADQAAARAPRGHKAAVGRVRDACLKLLQSIVLHSIDVAPEHLVLTRPRKDKAFIDADVALDQARQELWQYASPELRSLWVYPAQERKRLLAEQDKLEQLRIRTEVILDFLISRVGKGAPTYEHIIKHLRRVTGLGCGRAETRRIVRSLHPEFKRMAEEEGRWIPLPPVHAARTRRKGS